MKICIVIPFFNHGAAIGTVLASLQTFRLPCFVVDDGSDQGAKAALAEAIAKSANVTLITLPSNQGKGAAVMAGCDAALRAGYTHAVQIDADGQHCSADIANLLDMSRRYPDALVTGQAVYDESVPKARRYGRYLTHVWVWINTLSLTIKDSMCGLRVYPLATACEVWTKARLGRRMQFDSEIMVRLSWLGVPIVNVPTRVVYPMDGVSHFKLLRDNVQISGMHARLFVGMLVRLPWLLGRRMARRIGGTAL